jgi:ADP-L-glycero-D-manno-heptose 6-epimerase
VKIILTGGAGFIGSCLLRSLNDDGIAQITVVDNIASTEKWKNLVGKKYLDYVHKSRFLEQLPHMNDITHIIHMGACSATTETNFDYLYDNNVEYTKALWNYCTRRQISFIYASSAATYGMGENGFGDACDLSLLKPLNGYGYSKQLFDLWAEAQKDCPKQTVGLKFFNVYGPNEYCKESMASVVCHGFRQISESGAIRLFKSYNDGYADGEQLRDFVYVKDVCNVVKYFIRHENISGLFNVGTGSAESFNVLAQSIFSALGFSPRIEYIDMPERLNEKYQYHTQADIGRLRLAGYTEPFCGLTAGVADYVSNYLTQGYAVY